MTGFQRYRKTHPTYAVELPRTVNVVTPEGTMSGDGGDYLCIDYFGNLYVCDAETFRNTYTPDPELTDTEANICRSKGDDG